MIKKHIPNALTCLNLGFGFWGILLLVNGKVTEASLCIGAALIVDFFDGFTARLLHVSSPIGKELDSLADVVSFGILPSIMLTFMIASITSGIPYARMSEIQLFEQPAFNFLFFLGTLPAMFSAVRLAKFNLDTRQSDRFFGVPTPSNAMVVASFNLIAIDPDSFLFPLVSNLYFICGYCILISYLLIAEIPLMALKFKEFSWKGNKYRYLLIILSLLLAALLQKESLLLIMTAFVLLSLLQNKSEKSAINL
jgi:CDP-diacylglycerol--serine O-phosphatidyltransferase